MSSISLASYRGRRLVVLGVLVFLTLIAAYHLRTHQTQSYIPWRRRPQNLQDNESKATQHPIDELIRRADLDFSNAIVLESYNLHGAAAAYRERRGRHPPPRFEEWYAYAKRHDAVMLESLFDTIYDDLEPFWGMPPSDMRNSMRGLKYMLRVRNGKLDNREDERYRVNFWHEMLRPIASRLPDLDIAFNIMDEPRLLVPWEDIENFMTLARDAGRLRGAFNHGENLTEEFATREPEEGQGEQDHGWMGQGAYWDIFRQTCPPDSAARQLDAIKDWSAIPEMPLDQLTGSHEGYVANWTIAKDACSHPHLRALHGTFIEPVSMSTSTQLFPLFGGSKLPQNNEVLVPAPRYWTTEIKFTGTGFWSRFNTINAWSKKKDEVMWRGVASGGRSRKGTWRHFQRHRFVSMLNSSSVEAAMHRHPDAAHFPVPFQELENDAVATMATDSLPDRIESFAPGGNVAFTDLECFPTTPKTEPGCSYTDPFYQVAEEVPMYRMFDYKYLPDIDGNSFSGRYRAFLQSSSLPIKATIYGEWHDSRLWPWKHFVPMDNTFVDFYGIMDYFLGRNGTDQFQPDHDREAEHIALEGQEWAKKVLRKEDMVIYMYRLLLEYARLCSDDRENMAYVEDLRHQKPRSRLQHNTDD